MPIVTLRLPDVKQKAEQRPRFCPNCKGEILQRWGAVQKPVKDNCYQRIQVYRYRCCSCGRTFRHYPEGVDRADQTPRMRKLAALFWVLGLSLRGVPVVLSMFEIALGKSSVWRDLQEQDQMYQKQRQWHPVRVLGIDGAYVLGWDKKKHPVLVAVDLGTGQPVAIGYVDEYDARAVQRFLQPLVQRLGVSVIVSDDLHTYRIVADKLDLEHQVCQFHLRRWVGRTLHELAEKVPKPWRWVLDEVKDLLAELPPEGSRRLFDLWKQIPETRRGRKEQAQSPLDQLRYLLIRLSEHWPSYRVFDTQPQVPWTNNGTEQIIGRMKMRSRTVRGYKSWNGMHAGLMLAAVGTRL